MSSTASTLCTLARYSANTLSLCLDRASHFHAQDRYRIMKGHGLPSEVEKKEKRHTHQVMKTIFTVSVVAMVVLPLTARLFKRFDKVYQTLQRTSLVLQLGSALTRAYAVEKGLLTHKNKKGTYLLVAEVAAIALEQHALGQQRLVISGLSSLTRFLTLFIVTNILKYR